MTPEAQEVVRVPAPVEDVRAIGTALILLFDDPCQTVADNLAKLPTDAHPVMQGEFLGKLRQGFDTFTMHLIDMAQAQSAEYLFHKGGYDISAQRSKETLPLTPPHDVVTLPDTLRKAVRHRVGSDMVSFAYAELLLRHDVPTAEQKKALQAIIATRREMERKLHALLSPHEELVGGNPSA